MGIHVVLLLNNISDGTAAAARAAADAAGLDTTLHHHDFPPGQQTAGHARRLAMERAAAVAGEAGVLFCTDADGRVAPDWLDANLHHLRHGADAVAGRALIDPADAALIPAALHRADAEECAYGALLDEIESLLDPDPADPWPRHAEHSGASICVTMAAYRQAGGIPAVPIGEDRAFFRALRLIDARIRHAPEVQVTVSGRIVGRARGGMADTIRRRMQVPDAFLDDALEPVLARVRRVRLRRHVRAAMQDAWRRPGLAARLGWPAGRLDAALQHATVGMAWASVEANAVQLVRRPLEVARLATEAAVALRTRDRLRGMAIAEPERTAAD